MNTIFSKVQAAPRALLLVLALGLVIRTLAISFHERPLISDEREYDLLANNLVDLHAYTYGTAPTAYRPVGYPLIVAAVYCVVGHHPVAMKFIQGLLDVTTSLLIYVLLIPRSQKAALSGAALWAFYPPAVLYANFLMTETVFTFLLILFLLFLVRPPQSRTLAALVPAFVLAVLAIMKPAALLLLVIPLIMYKKLELSRFTLITLFVTTFVMLAPWALRNYSTFGRFSLSSNGGINLLIGNHPDATGAYNLRFDPAVTQGAAGEFDAEARASSYAWGYIKDHPGRFFLNGVKKMAHLFESEGGLLVWSFHSDPESQSERFAAKYRNLPLLLILLVNLPYMLITIMALVGFFSQMKDNLWWTTLAVLAVWLTIHFVFFGGSRFHFPLMPLLTAYAALAITTPLGVLKSLHPASKALMVLLTGLLLTLWIFEFVLVLNA